MDSEGIWNACTIKVIAKRAITTVERSDCSDVSQDSFGDSAAVAAGACSCCGGSGAISGGVFNRRSLEQWDGRAGVPVPAALLIAPPASWWKLTRAQHTPEFRPLVAGYAPP